MCHRCKSKPAFRPPTWTLAQLKASIPPRLRERSTKTGFLYVLRDMALILFSAATILCIDYCCIHQTFTQSPQANALLRTTAWLVYWGTQGLALTGLWIIGHECGHGAFSPSRAISDITGFVIHTLLGTPYHSWKYSHLHHHNFNGHIEKDEHFIPESRTEPILPNLNSRWEVFLEAVEDTPIYQLAMLIVRQLIGFQLYILFNVSGQPRYPRFTSHLNPSSVIFKPHQYSGVIISDLGLLSLLAILWAASRSFGFDTISRIYVVPWLLMSHWISMIVYLQHSDPYLPLFRSPEWTFARGNLTTMDREFLGWIGVFFFHNISHFHVVHHIDAKIPFYNTPEATECIKKVLGDDYNFCETPVFEALWFNYKNCRYVDRDANIMFYKNKYGEQLRTVSPKLHSE